MRDYDNNISHSFNARPFLKWAGGKTQILDELVKRLPENILQTKTIEKYVEPFVGGGALFFYLKNNFKIKQSFLFDLNKELIIGYKVIKKDKELLINELKAIERVYKSKNESDRKKFYYEMREKYNQQINDFNYSKYDKEWIIRASLLIFLNKTCFNGLFRQNKKGEFNVPFGSYKNPRICYEENILAVNKALEDTKIYNSDFNKSKKYIDKNTLVYLDPPYRPINDTSGFTSYYKKDFTEKDQIRLSDFFNKMTKKGAYALLNNSDPKNINPNDDFFDDLYNKYNINRVKASRIINCIGSKRGKISELIIRNY